jgi:hypothetical protein
MRFEANSNNAVNFVAEKLGIDKYGAYKFIKEYNECYYIDLAMEALNQHKSGFPEGYDFLTIPRDTCIELGKVIETAQLLSPEKEFDIVEDFLDYHFGDYTAAEQRDFFVGKKIIINIKPQASGVSKRCDCVLCTVISYSKDLLYVKNDVDNCIYCTSKNDIAD